MTNEKDIFNVQKDFTKCNVKITEKSHTKTADKDNISVKKAMKNENKKALIEYGNKIKNIRESMGLTQDDVIDLICTYPEINCGLYTRESISRLENGKRTGYIYYRRLQLMLLKIKENKYYENVRNRKN